MSQLNQDAEQIFAELTPSRGDQRGSSRLDAAVYTPPESSTRRRACCLQHVLDGPAHEHDTCTYLHGTTPIDQTQSSSAIVARLLTPRPPGAEEDREAHRGIPARDPAADEQSTKNDINAMAIATRIAAEHSPAKGTKQEARR